jgi:hypothetical protein
VTTSHQQHRKAAREAILRLAFLIEQVERRASRIALRQAEAEEQTRRHGAGIKRWMTGTGWQLGQSNESRHLRRRFEQLLRVELAKVEPELAAIRRKIGRICCFWGFNDIDANGQMVEDG